MVPQVEIVTNRELRVSENGKAVPATQIRMENGEWRMFNAAGDLLRTISADSARLEKRSCGCGPKLHSIGILIT